ncbi:ADP-glyceromanno-heptose 6-epimerase [Fusobacterium perfoetens]|uniref:ADP-glyceromanno-heptose 6-epimerase n=1 Tax=Fusobacterium perfoetens TaxID=852 RepID=UPI001F379C92|nr:ADP-glyceromanno-heptose 6-epimerase [Fusobacterium perfoetens]MCF2624871.1 ADP-glyceromanno-heptose 6-epimerase [Fusobacterium perfoetens]
MIIVTGAAGFIGSAFIWKLNEMGINDILAVDKMRTEDKWLNLRKRDYADWVDRDNLFEWLADEKNAAKITGVAHFGACSATTERDGDFLMSNNYGYTKKLWEFCADHNINFVNASSAATYGAGEQGYDDDITVEQFHKLLPLNKYGYSKKLFDDWSFKQTKTPKQWISCKFFNVYGPQEYHKGRMASMVFHTFNQYKADGGVKLFKSHKEGYADGEQLRDFVYIKDVVDLLYYFLTEEVPSGVYNVGTGKARSFKDLSMATMRAASGNPDLKEEYVITFVPMPEDLRGKYQYFTEAKMDKVKKAGYTKKFHTLEEGVYDYVVNYLSKEDPYL